MRAAILWAAFLLASVFSGAAEGRILWRAASADGDGGAYINIIVRKMRVAPVRAHVGEPIRIELTIEDYGDLFYATREVTAAAGRRIVARRLVTWGTSGEGGRIKTVTLVWDTRHEKPGEYRIRGEAFVFEDASPFDNFLDLAEPVLLVPPGEPFPGGRAAGGEAEAVDPRYREAKVPFGSKGAADGY